MLCTRIFIRFELLVFERFCGLFIVISESSDTFCIVAVFEGPGTISIVVVSWC